MSSKSGQGTHGKNPASGPVPSSGTRGKVAKGSLAEQRGAPAKISEPALSNLRLGTTGNISKTPTADELINDYNVMVIEMTHITEALSHLLDFADEDADKISGHGKALDVRGSQLLDQGVAWREKVREFHENDESEEDYDWDTKSRHLGGKYKQLEAAIKKARSLISDQPSPEATGKSTKGSMGPPPVPNKGKGKLTSLSGKPPGQISDATAEYLLEGLGPELDDIETSLEGLDLAGTEHVGSVASGEAGLSSSEHFDKLLADYLPSNRKGPIFGWSDAPIEEQLKSMREFEHTLPRHEGNWSNAVSEAGSSSGSEDSQATERARRTRRASSVEDMDVDDEDDDDVA